MELHTRCRNGLRITILSAIGVMLIASSLLAQDSSKVKFLIGPVVGYNGVVYSTSEFSPLASRPGFFIVENGQAGSQFWGISAEIPIISGMDKFLIIEGIYDSKTSDFSALDAVSNDSSITLSASLSYILFNVGFKYNFLGTAAITTPKGFGIQAMMSFGWAINHAFITHYDSVVYTITDTYPNYYYTNSHTMVSNINGLNQIRIAIRADLTYDIPISSSWLLTPYVGFDTPLTKVDNTNRDWITRSVYAAVALRFAFGSN